MSVNYSFLDKNKKVIKTYPGQACFYQTNYLYKEHKTAVYFSYHVNTGMRENEVLDYINFLNSTKHFYKINVEDFMKTKTYTFKIKRQNSLRSFAILTALRYLDEESQAVRFIVKNKNNKNISKMKLLLLSCMYTNNSGHFLNKSPEKAEDFITYKLPPLNRTPDDKITSIGLHSYYSNYKQTWGMSRIIMNTLINNYKVQLL